MAQDRWVFKSKWDFKLNIKPAQRKAVADAYGNNMLHTEKGIFVKFLNGLCVVDEHMSKAFNLPASTIADWMQKQSTFNSQFWLIESPEKPATKEVEKEIEEAGKNKTGPKVVHGTRKR